MGAAEEQVEVVDDDGRVLDVVARHVMRAGRLLHRCTYVVVLNRAGEVYVHRRTPTKDVYPGMYDVTAGGVCGVGESYDDGAAREVAEELGVLARPVYRFRHRYDGEDGRVLGAAYDVVWGGPIRHQPSEVEWGAFVGPGDLERMIEHEAFCPDGLEVYRRWRAEVATTRG